MSTPITIDPGTVIYIQTIDGTAELTTLLDTDVIVIGEGTATKHITWLNLKTILGLLNLGNAAFGGIATTSGMPPVVTSPNLVFQFAGAGTYTNYPDASSSPIVLTEALNVVTWDGTKATFLAFNIDLTSYQKKATLLADGIAAGLFSISNLQNNLTGSTVGTKALDAALGPQILSGLQQINNLVDINSEKNQALFISLQELLKGQYSVQNTAVVLTPTNVTDNVITVDSTSWGTIYSQTIPIACLYTDGTHGVEHTKSITSSLITLESNPAKEIASIMALHDSNTGFHMTDYGFKAMGEWLYNFDKRSSYRYIKVNKVDIANGKSASYSDPKIYAKNTDGSINMGIVLGNFSFIGGATGGGSTSGGTTKGASIIASYGYQDILNTTYYVGEGDAAGKGVSILLSASFDGFIELYVGTSLSKLGKCIVTCNDGTSDIFTQTIYGSAKRLTILVTTGNYTLTFVTASSDDCIMYISDIITWQKRIVTGEIFSSSNKVTFLCDSWGEYTPLGGVTPYVPRFDGTFIAGNCTMPTRFRDLFVAGGGNINNVQFACRGGQTTAWAVYWIDTVIAATKPTHIVFNFSINDYNSAANVAGMTDSAYDFSPTNMWTQQNHSAGGIFGSVTQAQWLSNLQYLANKCYANGIQPIFFMPPKVGSISQSLALGGYNSLLQQGFNS